MITLETIRKDMEVRLNLDKEIKSVEVHADTLDEALADAAVQLNTKVSNLEYEVIEKGFEGFFGLASKPWTIVVYQNLETISKIAKEKDKVLMGDSDIDDEELNTDKDGEYFIRHFGNDILIKVNLPIGNGKNINHKDIISELNRPDTKNFDDKKIKHYAENGTGGVYEIVGSYTRTPANDAIFVIDIAKDEMKATW